MQKKGLTGQGDVLSGEFEQGYVLSGEFEQGYVLSPMHL